MDAKDFMAEHAGEGLTTTRLMDMFAAHVLKERAEPLAEALKQARWGLIGGSPTLEKIDAALAAYEGRMP